jgi:hypothetical protein
MKTVILAISFIFLIFLNATSQSTGFEWAKGISGSGNVSPSSVKTDNDGNIFVAGEFSGRADFNPGEDSLFLESHGHDDIFFSKYNSQGQLIWAKNIGENYNDVCNSMALDESNNIYITGHFARTVDFDPGNETHELSVSGGNDIFIAKYDSAGNFKWATSMGLLNASDEGISITTDKEGNVLITGWFQGTVDFDPGNTTFNLTSNGPGCFILKLSAGGNFIWAKNIDSTEGWVEGHTIRTDANNNVFVSGLFQATTDFNPGAGNHNMEPATENAAFLLKLDKNGNFKWAVQPGGYANNSNLDKKRPFGFDSEGNIYLAYHFSNTIDFNPKEEETLLTADDMWPDIFIQKLDTLGNLLWVKQIGGADEEGFGGLHVDNSGNLLITGYFTGTVDFDAGNNVYELFAGDEWNRALFIAKYNSEGNLMWAHPVNWSENDGSWPYGNGFDLTADFSGNVISVGQFNGKYDFNPNGTPSVLNANGDNYTGYIVKLNGISSVSNFIDNDLAVQYFPNPFSEKITVSVSQSLQNAELWLRSVSGKTIIHKQNLTGNNIEINTGNIPAGIYFLEIKQKDTQIVGKVIKQ